jgi:membrane protein
MVTASQAGTLIAAVLAWTYVESNALTRSFGMEIPGLRGLGVVELIKKSVKEFLDDDMTTYAAALAYQVLFSIFPFIIFLVSLLGFLHMPQFFEWLQQQAQLVVPGQAMTQVNEVIQQLQQPQSGLLSIGAVTALWVASAAVRSLMNALNVAYDVEETRPSWKLYLLSVLYTVGLAAMLIASAAMLLIGPQAMDWLAAQVGLEQVFVTVWTWLRWPVSFLLLTLVMAIIYWAGPNVKQSFRFITPGAFLAVLVWVVASVGFGYYVSNFADYGAMYGSIGAIIILLFYFYISAAVLLFGAEINAVVERHAEGRKTSDNRNASRQSAGQRTTERRVSDRRVSGQRMPA